MSKLCVSENREQGTVKMNKEQWKWIITATTQAGCFAAESAVLDKHSRRTFTIMKAPFSALRNELNQVKSEEGIPLGSAERKERKVN